MSPLMMLIEKRQQVITESNKSPLIEVLTWFALAVNILFLAARVFTRTIQVGKLKLDDYLAISALLAALGQSVAVLKQCSSGWGQHLDTLDADATSSVLKSGYAADLLFVLSLTLGKLSFATVTSTLTSASHKRILWGIQALVVLWAVSAIFALFFQCSLPTPWDYVGQECLDRAAFWTYFSVANIVTEVLVLGVAVEAIRRIQTTWSRKRVAMIVFGARVLVLPPIAFQMYYSKDAVASADPLFDMWQASIIIQVVQCISIVTACVPVLKPLADSLESGQLSADYLSRTDKRAYGSSGRKYPSNTSGNRSATRQKGPAVISQPIAMETFATATAAGSWDKQSQISQKGLIHQTLTWNVEIERRGSSPGSEESRRAA